MRFLLIFLTIVSFSFSAKIKDIANIVGVRSNHLIGYGLVIGLKGTGDGKSQFTIQSLSNMLKGVNVKVEPTAIKSDNIAAVMVTAELPAFARQGDKIDVSVSSIGEADSLEGGILVMTSLKGVDGRIYALAQGQLTIGSQNRKDATIGTIPSGAVIEREIENDIYTQNEITLSLKKQNFANAVTIQNTLNGFFGKRIATAMDSGTVKLVKVPNLSMIEFLATLEDINIRYQRDNKIIIDEKTGTVVAGSDIEIEPVVITNGDITIKVPSIDDVKVVNNIKEGVGIDEQNGLISIDAQKPTVANVVRSLARLGAKAQQIISILDAMKRAGAINVDLEVI
jgi:flagellar P-ring protein precursor FlgI